MRLSDKQNDVLITLGCLGAVSAGELQDAFRDMFEDAEYDGRRYKWRGFDAEGLSATLHRLQARELVERRRVTRTKCREPSYVWALSPAGCAWFERDTNLGADTGRGPKGRRTYAPRLPLKEVRDLMSVGAA